MCPEQAARFARIDGALAQRPDDPSLHYLRAAALGTCGAGADAAAALHRVRDLGVGFLPVPDVGFQAVWNDPAVRAEVRAMEAMLPRVAENAPTVARLEDPEIVPEGIAYDAETQRLFVSSLTRGGVIEIGPDGVAIPFAQAPSPLTSTLGVANDSRRRRVYVVATNAILGEVATPTNAVLELDADHGTLLRRLDAQGAGQLNDVAIAPDGAVYATDSWLGGLWRAEPSASALARWPQDLELYGANGIATGPEDVIYVAHATGIARIDRVTGEVLPRLANETHETLAAIDGLYFSSGRLVGVQNVTNPGRVIAARLDPSGTRVVAVSTLLSHHHPALAEPTTGAVDGTRFLLLASSFVGRLRPDGTLRDPSTMRPAEILEIPLPWAQRHAREGVTRLPASAS